jgi:hypothetical protein
MLQQFRKLKLKEREVSSLQDNIALILSQITKKPIVDGELLTNIILPAGSFRVNHKLGRTPLGFILSDINAAVTVHREAWDSNTITLNASGPVTISLWVY